MTHSEPGAQASLAHAFGYPLLMGLLGTHRLALNNPCSYVSVSRVFPGALGGIIYILVLACVRVSDLYIVLEAAVPHPSAQDDTREVVHGLSVFSKGGRLGILLLQTCQGRRFRDLSSLHVEATFLR